MRNEYEEKVRNLESQIPDHSGTSTESESAIFEEMGLVGYRSEVFKQGMNDAIHTYELVTLTPKSSKRNRTPATTAILKECGIVRPTREMTSTVRRRLSDVVRKRRHNLKPDVKEKKRNDERKRRATRRVRTSSRNDNLEQSNIGDSGINSSSSLC